MHAPAGWSHREGTLARELVLSGHGLHTGRRVNVRVLPGTSNSPRSIVFRRVQQGKVLAEFAVSPAWRRAQPLCTMLESAGGVRVRTVEHLLASLLACEIDRATVELDAEEVPILDGSAQPWLDAIRACGRVELPEAKRFIRVLRPVEIVDDAGTRDERSLSVEPASAYEMTVRNDLKGFGELRWDGALTPASFAGEIAPSRSYGRVKWAIPAILAGYVRGMPILRGARLSCTAAIVGNRVLGGMRVPDEFVRHRVLDLVGDMAMAGAPLLGRVRALRPSHEMNYRLVAALLADCDAWEWAEFAS
ncbi:UDP-3-O-acyl N-acetylglycosamine deacetylase [Paraburkholderia sp. Ac-20336]|uniref:UDP-3-O-acyl N-acetylglycosamine deacetylase n=1 Tax=Burkholderiaceae TaxID=119060 RepID=UPI001420A46D|nr:MULTISPECIES: UDP-3-O-acyl N-acetylglycosamine deacetylase [Burkholderiaceae]MBN3804593.1 UDP-3-O-acyl N-acetylglycosamine deacetylase [Paraburkholderia sp. Ac-20336]MBN3849923.1 UDP-3-O-acyl N-acetylglycosamine deacetylase [Paraburkholderia sp. Ac-20342]NIF56117.1 UDP-3-O-acyl N-acetylglycosamine deacetylase [Burkholderia sp. Ax-1724]NIF80743.1 UDP-3-O-acyl N-acetylglycosamine deacetylase [Paraburkholderia sp. Cy-641]